MKLWIRRQCTYEHIHCYEDEYTNLIYHILTQYTLKVGIQRYKEHSTKGFEADIKQIHDNIMFAKIKKSALNQQQCSDVLQAQMLLE